MRDSQTEPRWHRVRARLRGLAGEMPGAGTAERGAAVARRGADRGVAAITEKVGGPARARVVVLLAAVLGLASADTGAIGAIAPKLEQSLHIGNVQIGLLVTVAALTAAAGMLPVGWVTDRWDRTRLVTVAVWLWGAAEIISAFSPNYAFLLVVRLSLGALTAVTGPTIASLTGDFFPARERSQIYGYILTGELIGAGFGLLVAGLFSAWFSWRIGLGVLCIPSFFLAVQLHRRLPEPARGGQSRLERGAEEILTAEDIGDFEPSGTIPEPAGAIPEPAGTIPEPAEAPEAVPLREETEVLRQIEEAEIDPDQGLVLDRDPLALGWWAGGRHACPWCREPLGRARADLPHHDGRTARRRRHRVARTQALPGRRGGSGRDRDRDREGVPCRLQRGRVGVSGHPW